MEITFIDKLVDDILYIIRIIIPLSFTIFIFAYRERKDISYSLFKNGNRILNLVYIIISFLLLIIIYSGKYSENNLLTSDYVWVLWILLVVWAIFILLIYKKILESINLFSVIRINSKSYSNAFQRLNYQLDYVMPKSNYETPEQYKFLNYKDYRKIKNKLIKATVSVEIVYQILLSKLAHNLSNDFVKSFNKNNKQIVNYIEYLNTNHINYLTTVFYEDYFNLYSTVLKNNLLLLKKTSKLKSLNDINLIIISISELVPNISSKDSSKLVRKKDYLNEYYKNIYEAITILEDNHNYEVINILKLIYRQEQQTEKFIKAKDLLSLSIATMIYSIERNNVKLLTDIINVLLDLNRDPIKPSRVRINAITRYEFDVERVTDIVEGISEKKEEVVISRVLLLGIVKSVELGHYSCAGYLIKILVNKVDPELMIKSINFLNDIKNKQEVFYMKELNKMQVNMDLLNDLNIDYYFSKNSFKYCFHKSIFLLYAHQQKMIEMGLLNIEDECVVPVNELIMDDMELEFLGEKVKGLHRNYGLIVLKPEDSFWN